ncbi:MAG: hypothetical protein EZS28_033926, partial [Streblomastix strix]
MKGEAALKYRYEHLTFEGFIDLTRKSVKGRNNEDIEGENQTPTANSESNSRVKRKQELSSLVIGTGGKRARSKSPTQVPLQLHQQFFNANMEPLGQDGYAMDNSERQTTCKSGIQQSAVVPQKLITPVQISPGGLNTPGSLSPQSSTHDNPLGTPIKSPEQQDQLHFPNQLQSPQGTVAQFKRVPLQSIIQTLNKDNQANDSPLSQLDAKKIPYYGKDGKIPIPRLFNCPNGEHFEALLAGAENWSKEERHKMKAILRKDSKTWKTKTKQMVGQPLSGPDVTPASLIELFVSNSSSE